MIFAEITENKCVKERRPSVESENLTNRSTAR